MEIERKEGRAEKGKRNKNPAKQSCTNVYNEATTYLRRFITFFALHLVAVYTLAAILFVLASLGHVESRQLVRPGPLVLALLRLGRPGHVVEVDLRPGRQRLPPEVLHRPAVGLPLQGEGGGQHAQVGGRQGRVVAGLLGELGT